MILVLIDNNSNDESPFANCFRMYKCRSVMKKMKKEKKEKNKLKK